MSKRSPLTVNLRQLDADNLHLAGEFAPAGLDIETRDEMIRVSRPLKFDLEVQQMEGGLLVQGRLELPLDCQCVRCLKPFVYKIKLDPWSSHVALEGEEAVLAVNDCVDLTGAVREDILLEFPQHPLCNPECCGLPKAVPGKTQKANGAGTAETGSPAWVQLNKLKL